mmetsp:Transcript_103478/g.205673  ORF Transcript_103478/g.205673 Transcript_103478/m.205673 type:complete len:203 (+) Transcript_103478:1970-2578(+)
MQERAAGELRNGDYLCTGPGESLPCTPVARVDSTVVFYVSFAEDRAVYIMTVTKTLAKGCPGDPSFSSFPYASPGSYASTRVTRLAHSAPPSVAPTGCRLQPRQPEQVWQSGQTEVIFKYRRSEDPVVLDVLRQLAQDAHCQHLLEGLEFEGSKHRVVLPTDRARILKESVDQAYVEWCASRHCRHGGRRSQLVWKPLPRVG